MSHKNVTKVVWYILVQLSSLNNTMPMVSPLRLKGYGGQAGVTNTRYIGLIGLIRSIGSV